MLSESNHSLAPGFSKTAGDCGSPDEECNVCSSRTLAQYLRFPSMYNHRHQMTDGINVSNKHTETDNTVDSKATVVLSSIREFNEDGIAFG